MHNHYTKQAWYYRLQLQLLNTLQPHIIKANSASNNLLTISKWINFEGNNLNGMYSLKVIHQIELVRKPYWAKLLFLQFYQILMRIILGLILFFALYNFFLSSNVSYPSISQYRIIQITSTYLYSEAWNPTWYKCSNWLFIPNAIPVGIKTLIYLKISIYNKVMSTPCTNTLILFKMHFYWNL